MSTELVVLRILHILPGAFWVGGAIFVAFLLEPVLKRLGPQIEGPVFSNLSKVVGPVMTVSGLVTIASGLALVSRTPGRSFDQLFANGWGTAIGIGLVTAVLAFGAGMYTGAQSAAMGRTVRAASPGTPPAPDVAARIEAIKANLRRASRANAVLVIVAVGSMAAARAFV
jgi:uncharacterized membrane protein